MNARHAVLAATTMMSLSLLTACGSSSSSSGSGTPTPPPTPAPTVTVTAPAKATAGYAFNIQWASTNASSCAADFDKNTNTTATISKTESAVGSKKYSVTCTGAGGSTTNSATVTISGAPTAEGTWNGTTDDNRNILGVVLSPDATSGKSAYWLGYSISNSDPNQRTPAGFIVGTGSSAPNYSDTTATSGTFSSNDLREFNFAAGRVNAHGTFTSPYVKKTSLGVASDTATITDYDFTGSNTNPVYPIHYDVAIGGTVTDYTGAPSIVGAYSGGSGTATLDASGLLTVHVTGVTQNVNLFHSNIVSVLDWTSTFQGSNSSGTFTISEPDAGITGSNAGGGSLGNETATNCSGRCDVPLLISALNTSHHYDYGSNGTVTSAGGTVDAQELVAGAYMYDRIFALTPAGATPTTTHFTSVYATSSVYDTPATLAAVAGSYSGLSIGIDSALHTNSGTFTIASDGSVTGSEPISHCNISSGTVTAHGAVNAYDVTVTFSSSGGTCIYAGKTFTGVALYESGSSRLSLMATSSDDTQGFMVVGKNH